MSSDPLHVGPGGSPSARRGRCPWYCRATGYRFNIEKEWENDVRAVLPKKITEKLYELGHAIDMLTGLQEGIKTCEERDVTFNNTGELAGYECITNIHDHREHYRELAEKQKKEIVRMEHLFGVTAKSIDDFARWMHIWWMEYEQRDRKIHQDAFIDMRGEWSEQCASNH